MAGGAANGTRRVVITGVGMVTPARQRPGVVVGRASSRASPAPGRSRTSTRRDYDVHFACELKDFEPTTWIDRKQARRMDRFSQLALSAARMAEADSGVSIAAAPDRVGAAVATGIGGLYAFENCFQSLLERGPDRTSPLRDRPDHPEHGRRVGLDGARRARARSPPSALPAPPRTWRSATGWTRSGSAVPTSCSAAAPRRRSPASGSPASPPCARSRGATTTRSGRRGRSTPVATGSSWARRRRCSCSRSSSTRARAARRSTPRCSATASRRTRATCPTPIRAARTPLARCAWHSATPGSSPEVIGYVNAHGTSTPSGDAAETRVLKLALGEEKAFRTPVSSTKGATGHCLGAAGAVEAIFTIFALQRGVLPPTINYEDPDPDLRSRLHPERGARSRTSSTR